jgi:CHAT domain-containing protein/Tfp pilus assembly protein PilF
MNIFSRYRLSLTAISLVACPLMLSVVTLPEVVFGAEVQELRPPWDVVAQKTINSKANAEKMLETGKLMFQNNNVKEGLRAWEIALNIYRTIKDLDGEVALLDAFTEVYRYLQDYPKAINYQLQYLEILKNGKDREEEATVLNNIGVDYYSLGQYQEAIGFHWHALAIRKELGNLEHEAGSLNNLGNSYREIGQYQTAIDFHNESLEIYKQTGNIGQQGSSLNNLGATYIEIGEFQKAIISYKQSLEIFKKVGAFNGQGTSLFGLGNIYQKLGQYHESIDYFQQSLALFRQVNNRDSELGTLNYLGASFFRTGNHIAAEQVLRSGIQLFESILATGGSDTNKVFLFDSQSLIYSTLQQVLVKQEKINVALEIAERGRARALVQLLADNSQYSQFKVQPKALSIKEIQQVAKERQATLVEYSIVYDRFKIEEGQEWQQSELYIWVVSPNGQITFRSVDLKPLWQKENTSLSELVENSRKGIGVNDRDSTGIKIVLNPEYKQQLRQEQSKYLRQLHQILIEPIADLLPTDPNARVVFMPQSALYLVPFAALQDKSEQYLIQKHTIAISPSIQVLSLTQQQSLALPTASARSSQNILIAGNPVMPKVFVPGIDQPLRLDDLQGAKQEAIAVANTLKTTALTGNKATKKAVVQQMQSARIIHLATHGLLDDFKGLGVPGAIALAPDGDGSTNDGLLTADEILGMKLKAELVVLSACNTGRGKITGDGVIGLSRSLISAGVPSIIVSLWSVPDAPTAELMSDFYTLLEQNPDKAKALRQAMLKTMKTHPDPRDWAAFTLIGES